MTTRSARVRFYAVQRKRVTIDPVWAPDGSIPVKWLLDGIPVGTPRPVDDASTSDTWPGLAHVHTGQSGDGYMVHPDEVEDDPDATVIYGELVDHDGVDRSQKMHLRLWEVKRQNLPSLHNLITGKTTALEDEIDLDGQGIAEAVDYVLFPDQCMAAVVFNQRGPSRNVVQTYVEEKTGVALAFHPLTRQDALDLVVADQVSFVEAEFVVGHLDDLGEVDGGDMVTAANQLDVGGLRTVKVSVTTEPPSLDRNQPHPPAEVWQRLKSKLRNLIGQRGSAVQSLRVGQRNTGDVLNLLDQHIGYEVDADLLTGRTVTAGAAFDAAVQAYTTNLESIRSAVGLVDSRSHNLRAGRAKRES